MSRGAGGPPAGRKKALLVACCYFNTRNQLGGMPPSSCTDRIGLQRASSLIKGARVLYLISELGCMQYCHHNVTVVEPQASCNLQNECR